MLNAIQLAPVAAFTSRLSGFHYPLSLYQILQTREGLKNLNFKFRVHGHISYSQWLGGGRQIGLHFLVSLHLHCTVNNSIMLQTLQSLQLDNDNLDFER